MKNDHPIYSLERNLLRKKPNLILEFSRYVYVTYGVTHSRETFHIKASDIINGWIDDQVDLLSEGQELAFHSRIKINEEDNKIYHLPMIDFINTKSNIKITEKILPVSKSLNADLFLYESGNSYHGYYFLLLTETDWHKFLGKLLLCNPPARINDDIVDSRWIGHSLEHGYSALRWSKKTEKYKMIPKLSKLNKNSIKTKLMFD